MLGQTQPSHSDSPVIEFRAATHPGNRYQHNEDALGWNERAGLWFIADGMGGHARGDIASATAKKALLGAATDPERSLTQLVMLAHEAVLLEGIEQALPNMGSTLVLARISGNQLNVAWCGDSRAYLWRAGELIRLTRDHSLLEQLLESGVVAPEDAFDHPRRNVLVQALGINDPRPVPSEISLTLDNDDVLLLCSDGIHDELHDTTMADVLAAMAEPPAVVAKPQAVVEELERRVLATDARDNLSVICLHVSALLHGTDLPLGVAALKSELEAAQHAAGSIRQRVVDTLELPAVPDVAAPQKVASAASAPRKPALLSGRKTSAEPANVSQPNTELWVALVCVALLVVLVLLFT